MPVSVKRKGATVSVGGLQMTAVAADGSTAVENARSLERLIASNILNGFSLRIGENRGIGETTVIDLDKPPRRKLYIRRQGLEVQPDGKPLDTGTKFPGLAKRL